jgi:class 3 adenylate cyclase/tetratricopeptide (TPR) repeat protein
MPVCQACGEENPARARFCMACSEPLPQQVHGPVSMTTGAETRKTVTVLFCDVVGSTPLGEQLEPESVRKVMTRFFDRMRGILERHGGTVEKYIGDAVMAVFGVPTLHEDDALRAVRAAAEMRAALDGLNAEFEPAWGVALRTRIGVNTGEVVVGDHPDASLVVGDTVNVAARLEQTAAPGEILLGRRTFALVRASVEVDEGRAISLKGKADPVTGYRLVEVSPGPERAERMSPEFVGRGRELASLREAFGHSERDRECVLLTVLGGAGMGKSRLAEEFAAEVGGEARVLHGRCLPYGDGITFWPVAELVREACGIGGDDGREAARAKIAAALGDGEDTELVADGVAAISGFGPTSAGMQETFWAIRRFLEILQQDRALVVLFDDIQWAESTFLDLVEYLAGWCREGRILLVCLARPELLEARPSWSGLESGAATLHLEPLTQDESRRLIGNLLGASPLDLRDSARIVDAAEGNPLFVEEMLRMLEDDGVLVRGQDRWSVVGDLSQVAVPATIQALLAARLDRLGPQERAVLGTASVIGKEFWWGAVSDLSPEGLRPAVGGHLQTLVRKGLILPERSTLVGEDAFRFHHILIQDASYQGLPKERRAELHERFAGWMEERLGDRMVEYEEVVGYHLEQASRYRAELGGADGGVGERASAHLATAGRRALARGDMAAAVTLLERSASLLPEGSAARAWLLPDLSESLMETGALVRAHELLSEAIASAEASGDGGLRSHATIVRLSLMESTDPKGWSEVALAELERVIPVFEGLGDDLGLARAWRLTADVHWTRSRYAAAGEAFERAIEHARRAGAGWEEAECLGQYAGSGAYGPAPVDEVVARCERILGESRGNRLVEAQTLRCLAAMRAMQGRFDEARGHVGASMGILEDLGLWLRAAFVSETSAFVERLAGDAAASEQALRAGYDVLEKLGERGFLSTAAALLSHEMLDQGRDGDAADFIEASEAAVAEDDLATQILLQSARGRALARRDEPAEAEARCRDAVRLAEETDDVNMHGDVLLHLAEVLDTVAADPGGAAACRERARALFDAKGNVAQSSSVP